MHEKTLYLADINRMRTTHAKQQKKKAIPGTNIGRSEGCTRAQWEEEYIRANNTTTAGPSGIGKTRPHEKHLEGRYPPPSARPSQAEGGSLSALARPSALRGRLAGGPHQPSFT